MGRLEKVCLSSSILVLTVSLIGCTPSTSEGDHEDLPPWSDHKCEHRNDWPTALSASEGQRIVGTRIREDRNLRLCGDCAERCWIQMQNCLGFNFEKLEPHLHDGPGICTYYSLISSFKMANSSDVVAVIGAEHRPQQHTPPTTPQPAPMPAPQPTPEPAPQTTRRPTFRTPAPEPSAQQLTISISGRKLLVDGTPLHLKGVCWNPIGVGGSHPSGLDFAGYAAMDSGLMKNAGINAVRTYEPITDRRTLDTLWQHGIYVINTVYSYGGNPASSVISPVLAVKDHPAILMWAVGNEWNYNGLYVDMDLASATKRVREAVRLVKQHDTAHPVTTVFGELPAAATLEALPDVDVWGINSYRGLGFGDLFRVWETRSGKPMYLGEYGADAYDARFQREDQTAQADATTALTREINAQSSLLGEVCLGGFIFELADEWWKDHLGRADVHDVGGVAPGAGPHPDNIFNEEWWGLVDINRIPRQAYHAYAAIPIPTAR